MSAFAWCSKRHSITPTEGVHRRHTEDSDPISKSVVELAKMRPALAWHARGRARSVGAHRFRRLERFESAMLHPLILNSDLALELLEC